MAKTLKRRPIKTVSKKLSVEDERGNKHILKATVISVSPKDIRKSRSASIEDDDLDVLGLQ